MLSFGRSVCAVAQSDEMSDVACTRIEILGSGFPPRSMNPCIHTGYFRCNNCGESRDYWQYVVVNEVLEVSGSRGEANLVEKCKLCSRVNTVAIVSDSIGKYNAADHNEEWQPLIQLDCRGLEPIDFDPRMGWTAVGTESGTVFDEIDLSEKVWADYDEKASEATEIADFEVRFVHAKTK